LQAPDLELLITAARGAGEIAKSYFQGENRVWDKGSDDPVSEADIAVDTYLRETLCASRPDYGWLSEETDDDRARLEREHVFIVDPIDGTRAFVAGQSTWAHSVAVVCGGVPVAGVVYLPMKDRLYAACKGSGASLNGASLNVDASGLVTKPTVLASRGALDEKHWPGGVPSVERHFRPSLAYRLCLVGEGRFDAMLTLRDSWEWDIAAGALIAAEAGATATDRTGAALRFNRRRPMAPGVLVAAPQVHQAMIPRLV
jgi:myo-inositol-1(or 4)-monophosphatase